MKSTGAIAAICLMSTSLCLGQLSSTDPSLRAPTPTEEQRRYRPSDTFKEEHGIRPPELPGRSNAAVEWYKVWDTLSFEERFDLGTVGGDVRAEPGYRLNADQIAVLEKHGRYIESLARVAAMPDCDWGVDYEAGYMAMLPYLGNLRMSTRALGADARRCVQQGDPIAGAKRLAAIVHLSRHACCEPVAICDLVGAAAVAYACKATQVLLASHELTPESARIIHNALKGIPEEDPFGLRRCIKGEQALGVDWVRGRFTGEHAGAELAEQMSRGGFGLDEKGRQEIKGLTGAQLATVLDESEPFYDEAARLWDAPDAVAKLKELEAGMEKGSFGNSVLNRTLAPAFSKMRESDLKVQGELGRTLKDLEVYLRDGRFPDPPVAAQPAVPSGS